MNMTEYKDWAPTGFDRKGLNLPDQQDWVVLISTNRDDDLLGESNWHVAQQMLDGLDGWEIHSFGHWACGWVETILVDPKSDAYKVALEISNSLESYPILDECDFSQREYNQFLEDVDDFMAYDIESMLEEECQVVFKGNLEDLKAPGMHKFYKDNKLWNCEYWQEVTLRDIVTDIASENETVFRHDTIQQSIDVIAEWLTTFFETTVDEHNYTTVVVQ